MMSRGDPKSKGSSGKIEGHPEEGRWPQEAEISLRAFAVLRAIIGASGWELLQRGREEGMVKAPCATT